MKIWFDTEFIEDGHTIDLISIGMVREDGHKLYFELPDGSIPWDRASEWVLENVRPHLYGGGSICTWEEGRQWILEFAGDHPEFWAYYADYDWVVLCQVFGRMIDLPRGWPMYCRDLKQLAVDHGDPKLPKQDTTEHNALNDAEWCRETWLWLKRRSTTMPAQFSRLDPADFREVREELGRGLGEEVDDV